MALEFRIPHTRDDFNTLTRYLPEMLYWQKYRCTSSQFDQSYFDDLNSLIFKWSGSNHTNRGCGSCIRFILEKGYVYWTTLVAFYEPLKALYSGGILQNPLDFNDRIIK